MRLWRFSDPGDHSFARASLRGTWSKDGGACEDCGSSSQRRVQPLVIEWEADSDLVGDFVWPGFGADLAVTERVGAELSARFTGFDLGPVEMVQDPKLARSKSSKPRVWLPYVEPPLVDLWVTSWVPIDREQSTITFVKKCRACGAEQFSIDGFEKREVSWDKDLRKAVETHIPRSGNSGLFVQRERLSVDVFRALEAPGWILCTDTVKTFIEERKYTNSGFLEVGEVIEKS